VRGREGRGRKGPGEGKEMGKESGRKGVWGDGRGST